MNIKKVTQKDRYGNTMSYEFESPEKPLDPTRLAEKQMEIQAQVPDFQMDINSMSAMIPPVMGEEFNMGDPMNHPGEPRGSDTVPAWLTPGEFVVNKEATEMFGPEIEAMNEVGKMAKGGEVQYHAKGAPIRQSAAQLMAGKDPADIVRMLGTLGNAYQYVAPAFGFEDGGDIPMPMSPLDALLHSREGYKDEVYLDSLGKPTVGAGHLLPDEFKDYVGLKMPKEQLDAWFEEDRNKAIAGAQRNVSPETWERLNRRQQNALASMAFQLGEAGQKKFKNMLKAIEEGDHREAAKQALTGSKGGKSKWLKQTPVRALDLAEAFDPDLAAQYRNAGGRVYDDTPVQYAFWGKLIDSFKVPEAGIVQIPEGSVQQQIYDRKAEEAGAAPSMSPEELAELDAAMGAAGGDYDDEEEAFFQFGGIHPENLLTDAGDLSGLEIPKPTGENKATEDMGMLGGLIDFFGGPSAIANIEAEEREQQAANAAAADAAEKAEVYSEKAKEALDAGDFDTYSRMDNAASAARQQAAEAAENAAKVEAENKAREQQRQTEASDAKLAALAEQHAKAKKAGDDAAAAEIEAQMMAEELGAAYEGVTDFTAGQGVEQEKTEEEQTKADEEKAAKDAEIQAMADQLAADYEGVEDWGTGGVSEQEVKDAQARAEQQIIDEFQGDKTKYTDMVRDKLTETLGGEIGGALGSLFDAGELTKMLVYAGGSMLMGASPMQALNFGLKQYLGGLDKKQAAAAKETATRQQQAVSMSGKFTPKSLDEFIKTGNMESLVPVAGKATHPKLTPMKVHVPGMGLAQVWEVDGQQMVKGPNGKAIPLTQTGARVYDEATMGNKAIEAEFGDFTSAQLGVINQGVKEDDDAYVKVNKQKMADQGNRIFQKWIKGATLPVDGADELKYQINGSIEDYLAAKQAFKRGERKTDPQSIDQFFEARMVSVKTGISTSLLDGTSVANMNELNNTINREMKKDGLEGNANYAKIMKTAQAAWEVARRNGDAEYFADRAGDGKSPFVYFTERLLADDPKALAIAESLNAQ